MTFLPSLTTTITSTLSPSPKQQQRKAISATYVGIYTRAMNSPQILSAPCASTPLQISDRSDMTRDDFICRLNAFKLDKSQYVVTAGGSLLLHGIRESTHDIDLSCTSNLADELEAKGFSTTVIANGLRRIEIAEDFEVYEDMSLPDFEIIDGIPAMTINEVIAMKKALGRKKDFRDLELIEKHLNK